MRTRNERRLELIKLHKKWCDRYVIYSLIVILIIFIAISVIMDQLNASDAMRPLVYILVATMILATIIWNAVALAVVEIQAVIEGRTPD